MVGRWREGDEDEDEHGDGANEDESEEVGRYLFLSIRQRRVSYDDRGLLNHSQ